MGKRKRLEKRNQELLETIKNLERLNERRTEIRKNKQRRE